MSNSAPLPSIRWVRTLPALILLAACSAPTDPIASLDDASSDPVVRLEEEGQVRGATFRVPAAGTTSSESADAFLDTFGEALGIPDRAAALMQREVQEAPNSEAEIVVYEGTQDGHPVFGSEYRVRVEDGEVTYAGGSIVDDPTEALGEPSISMDEAVACPTLRPREVFPTTSMDN